MRINFVKLLVSTVFSLTMVGVANAGVIVSPVSGVVNSGGTEGGGSLANTFDRSGLSTTFSSGVTDFSAYIAGNPTHTVIYSGFEWFSDVSSTAVVTYDLGAILGISQLALWNEEFSGVGTLDLLGSSDGVSFSALGSFSPTNNPQNTDYLADVFSFSSTNARFVRFEMSGCPQTGGGGYNGCSIGEVAFNVAAVPEPETYVMLLAGLGLIGFTARRSKAS